MSENSRNSIKTSSKEKSLFIALSPNAISNAPSINSSLLIIVDAGLVIFMVISTF